MGEESKESKKALVASSLINSNQKYRSIAKRKLEYTLVNSAKDDVTEKEMKGEVQNKVEENQFDHLYNINSITGLNFDPLKLSYPFYHELLKKKLIEVHEAIHSSPGGPPLPSPDPIPISSHHHFSPHEVDDMVTIEQSQDKNDLLGLFSSQIGSQSGILDDTYSHAVIDSFSDMEIVERKDKTTNNVITIESSDEDRFGTPRNSSRKLKKAKSLKVESPDDFFDLSKKRKKSIKSRVSSDDSSEEEQQNIPKKKNLICTPIIPSKHSRVLTNLKQVTEKYPPKTDFDSEEIIPETQELQSLPTPSPLPVPKSPSPGPSLSNLLFADELAADIDYSCKICGLYLNKTEEKAHRCITPGSSFIAKNIISRSAKKSSPSPPVSLVKKRRHTTRPSFFRNKKFDDEDVGDDYRIRNSNFDALDDHQTSTSYTPAVLPHDRVYNDVISHSPTERHSPNFNDDTMYHNDFQQQQDDDEDEEPWQRGEPTEDFELPPPAPKKLAPQYYNQFPDHEGASSPKKRTTYKYNKGGRGGKGRGKGKGREGFYRKGGVGKRK